MTKQLIYFLIIRFLLGFGTATINADEEITFVAQKYSDQDEDILLWHEAIVEEAFKQAGFKVRFVYRPWGRALEEVAEGLHDGAYTTWKNPQREIICLFSDPYSFEDIVFYRNIERTISFNENLTTLKSYKIGLPTG